MPFDFMFSPKPGPIGNSSNGGVRAPSQVTGLSATVISDTEIDLSWSTVTGATGYKIERKVGAGSYSVLVADTVSTSTSYNNTGLTGNTLYTYRVSAISAVGTGTASTDASGTTVDSNAQSYFNSVTDCPSNYKTILNQYFFVELKNAGLWTKLKYGIASPVSLHDLNALIDLKTATTPSGADLRGVDYSTTARSSLATPTPLGIWMKNSDYVKTGAIPSSLLTTNDTCIVHVNFKNTSGVTAFAYSSFQDASHSLQFSPRSGTNQAVFDNYSNTGSAGRNTASSITDWSGIWIINRRSSTDFEVYRNGVSVLTAANGGGSLPAVYDMVLGAQNNAGTISNYRNHTCFMHLWFSSLTSTERDALNTILANLRTALNAASPTRNIVMDGNSWTVYGNYGLMRKSQYYAFSNGAKTYNTSAYGVPGNSTAERNTAYATGAATAYSASYSKNILIFHEVRNDIWKGATVATAKANLDTYIANAEATGYTVVLIPPTLSNYSGNTGRTETQFNLDIDTMYQYCLSKATASRYVITLPSQVWLSRSDPSVSSDADYNTKVAAKIANTTYYYDSTHKTAEGNRLIAQAVAQQALDLIG